MAKKRSSIKHKKSHKKQPVSNSEPKKEQHEGDGTPSDRNAVTRKTTYLNASGALENDNFVTYRRRRSVYINIFLTLVALAIVGWIVYYWEFVRNKVSDTITNLKPLLPNLPGTGDSPDVTGTTKTSKWWIVLLVVLGLLAVAGAVFVSRRMWLKRKAEKDAADAATAAANKRGSKRRLPDNDDNPNGGKLQVVAGVGLKTLATNFLGGDAELYNSSFQLGKAGHEVTYFIRNSANKIKDKIKNGMTSTELYRLIDDERNKPRADQDIKSENDARGKFYDQPFIVDGKKYYIRMRANVHDKGIVVEKKYEAINEALVKMGNEAAKQFIENHIKTADVPESRDVVTEHEYKNVHN